MPVNIKAVCKTRQPSLSNQITFSYTRIIHIRLFAMDVPKLKKSSVAHILNLINKLSPEEQEELRQAFLKDQEDMRICLDRLQNPKTISHKELKKKLGVAN